MDYIVGFIFGFILKELFNLLKYINTSETFIIDNNWDEECDWMTRPEDLP